MNDLPMNIELDESIGLFQFLHVHPNLLILIGYVANYCKKQNVHFKITSLIRTEEKNRALKASSQTHVDGRACDFSLRPHHGWDYFKIQRLVDEVTYRFADIGAISNPNLLPRPIIVHDNQDGTGKHAHLQVRP